MTPFQDRPYQDNQTDPSSGSTTSPLRGAEWPTVAVAAAIYGAWVTVVLTHDTMPSVLTMVLLAVIVAWHGSLQHETVHGHPFRSSRANTALATVSLGFRVPYGVYRRSHLQHHECVELTDPELDTESYYLEANAWCRLPVIGRALCTAHNTFLGRLILGPPAELVSVWRRDIRAIMAGNHQLARWWLAFIVQVGALTVFVVAVVGMPWWVYLIGSGYLAHSLGLVRSFIEHQWVDGGAPRSAMVRSRGFFALLFLNNNLHHAHHADPGVAWYRLPATATATDAAAEAQRGAGWYSGYGEIAGRYLLRPFDHPVHPPARSAVTMIEGGPSLEDWR